MKTHKWLYMILIVCIIVIAILSISLYNTNAEVKFTKCLNGGFDLPTSSSCCDSVNGHLEGSSTGNSCNYKIFG